MGRKRVVSKFVGRRLLSCSDLYRESSFCERIANLRAGGSCHDGWLSMLLASGSTAAGAFYSVRLQQLFIVIVMIIAIAGEQRLVVVAAAAAAAEERLEKQHINIIITINDVYIQLLARQSALRRRGIAGCVECSEF